MKQFNFNFDTANFAIGFAIFKPIFDYKLGISIDILFFSFWVYLFKIDKNGSILPNK